MVNPLIWFQTHISALIYLLPKGKERQQIAVRVLGEESIAEQTFDYSPPYIYKAESSYGLTFPTSGKTPNGSAIYILIYGDNFGLGDKTEVYFEKRQIIS